MVFLNILLLFLVLNCKITIIHTAINVPSENNSILHCVHKIHNAYNTQHVIIIIGTINPKNYILPFTLNSSITLYIGAKYSIPHKFWQFHNFIFIIEHVADIKTIFKSLYGTQLWNSRGKYLVAYFGKKELLNDIFKVSWEYYIYNINVVTLNDAETNIYTYFPYKHNNCGIYMGYDYIDSCTTNNLSNIFIPKIPLDMNGCTIRLMAYPMLPYVINLNANREKAAKSGLEITILNVLSQRMNFTELYIPHNHTFWGFKDRNGSYQYMFGALFRNECDLTVGMQFGNASHVIDFDAGVIHLQDASVWWVPSAAPIAQWKNLSKIFQKDVWLGILIVYLVNGFTWWLIGKMKEPYCQYKEIVLAMMSSLYSMLQGSVTCPNSWIVRFTFIIWLLSCLLIFTAYQSQLVSILTSPLYDKQIASMEEVVNSSLEYGMFVGAALAFQDPNNWVHVKIMANYQQCPLSNFCMNRTAFKRDFVASRNLRNSRYFIPRFYTGANGKMLVYPLEFDRLGIWVRFYMTKGFPLLDRMNNLLMQMQSNGLIAKWDSDIAFYVMKIESESDHKPLTTDHLQAAFYILGFGLLFAFIIFFCELGTAVIKKSSINKK